MKRAGAIDYIPDGVSLEAGGAGGAAFLRLAGARLEAAFLAGLFFAAVFFVADFLATDLFLVAVFFTAPLRVAFLATTLRPVFFAAVFLAGLFFAAAFLAAFFAGALAICNVPFNRLHLRAFQSGSQERIRRYIRFSYAQTRARRSNAANAVSIELSRAHCPGEALPEKSTASLQSYCGVACQAIAKLSDA